MKIWAKTVEFSEGKYLVVRRDGTIPPWPHFVIGADDPNAPAALRGYAAEAEKNKLDADYVASLRELADEWEQRPPGKADPDAPPHRTDNPAIIRLMRGEGNLSELGTKSTLHDLQHGQPWAVPYSSGFNAADTFLEYLPAVHNTLHAAKTVGKLAAVFESLDHRELGELTPEEFETVKSMAADLMTEAMRFANLLNFELEEVLKRRVAEKNGIVV